MTEISRRSLLIAGAATAAAAAFPNSLSARTPRRGPEVIVVGAGVFGVWTARKLQEAGHRVRLIDAWGPAHARASSGGESRMTRAGYGADAVYTRMAWDSLAEWRSLSDRSGLPVFHRTGVLFFAPRIDDYFEQSIAVHRRLRLPIEVLDGRTLRRRFAMIDFSGIEAGLYEPGFGALMARRAVQTLFAEFLRAGGTYHQKQIRAVEAAGRALSAVTATDGTRYRAERFVFACGPWLGRIFPELLGRRIFPTRQEVFFFAPAAGDDRFEPGRLPGWADFNGGDIYYGFPNLEGRGFKIAHDAHGPAMDPDTGDRTPSPAALADVRAFMARRFPLLADRPLSEARVCQYENSSNGDFLIDRHPALENVVLVGGGSGHGFKHGPAVGRYAADLLLGRLASPEPRFSLATKAERAERAVH
ncbi:MAG TPA: FAD-dependent oxidoreductase [Allosphingosinicella sp.]|nr:FAD-dependent oxidoreductase [Allosphingosinicella sp.]